MFPTIFSVGPFTLFTFNIFLILGVVGGAFLFWQRSHAEHFEDDEVFDVMLISSIMALILSRVMYVALHLTTIFMDMKGWLEAIGKPGFDELTALVVGLWYVWFLSRRKKWDAFELADFGAISVCFAFIFIWIGRFFAGTFVGDVTGLPMGVNFPNVFDKRHPTQLYFALCFLLLYIVLLFLEKRYRFFQWYRAGKHMANSGFVLSVFLFSYGLIHLLLSFVDLQQTVVLGVRLDLFFYILMMLAGVGVLFMRSGMSLFPKKKWGSGGGVVAGNGGGKRFFGKK